MSLNILLFNNLNSCSIYFSFTIRILALEENFLLQFQMDVSALLLFIWLMENMRLNHVTV